jgi:3D (Asp-Asp-Asp) domain-containing protein
MCHQVVIASVCALLAAGSLDAQPQSPTSAKRLRMTATAYCDKGTTDSGEQTRRGTIAADPRVLPMGSVVNIDVPLPKYSGTYTVVDTGAKIKGSKVDIFIPNCASAKEFGKRVVRVSVVELGKKPT